MLWESSVNRKPKYISERGLISRNPRRRDGALAESYRPTGIPTSSRSRLNNVYRVVATSAQRDAGRHIKAMKMYGDVLQSPIISIATLNHEAKPPFEMSKAAQIIQHKITRFLNTSVPPWPSKQISTWQHNAEKLGELYPSSFLEALHSSPPHAQYVALLVLRQIGWDVSAEGYGKDVRYTVRSPEGLTHVIRPNQVQNDIELLPQDFFGKCR
jgi:hypothetical protein